MLFRSKCLSLGIDITKEYIPVAPAAHYLCGGRFEGMSCDSQIYVNGSILKHNYSGYNSFCVDMTDMANFGVIPNTIAIHMDASAWEGWWYEGAGIYRPHIHPKQECYC